MTRIHLSLRTRDLSASTAFYEALLGCPPDKVRADLVRFQPPDVPLALALTPGRPGDGPHHLGLKLPGSDQAEAAWRRLDGAGLSVRTERGSTCCWAVQDKAWVSDPDGRAWEVYAVTDDLPAVARDVDDACCATSTPSERDASCCS